MHIFQLELPDPTQTKAMKRDLFLLRYIFFKNKSLFLFLVFLSSQSHSSGMSFYKLHKEPLVNAKRGLRLFIIHVAGRFELTLTKLSQTIAEAPWPHSHCQPGLPSPGQCRVNGGCTPARQQTSSPNAVQHSL